MGQDHHCDHFHHDKYVCHDHRHQHDVHHHHYHHIQEHWNLDHWHHEDALPEGEDILARLQSGGDQKSINW